MNSIITRYRNFNSNLFNCIAILNSIVFKNSHARPVSSRITGSIQGGIIYLFIINVTILYVIFFNPYKDVCTNVTLINFSCDSS